MTSEQNSFFGGLITGASILIILYLLKRYLWCLRVRSSRVADAPREFSPANEYILTLVVRSDIPMVKSKLASHCSHASVLAFDTLLSDDPQAARFWQFTGQPKIIVAADSIHVINRLDDLARRLDLITTFICDDRRSLVGPTTVTVLAIGPGPKNVVDRITHDLRIM